MVAPRLIICEAANRWTPPMRRLVRSSGVLVRQTPRLDLFWEELAAAPTSVVALEVSVKTIGRVLADLELLGRRFPDTVALVLGTREAAPLEWLLRESGAVHAAFSPRRLDPVARVVARHAALSRHEPADMRRWAWARLPWGT